MTQKQVIERNKENSARYAGVDALAFWVGESNAVYHAIGVYRVCGKLHVSHVSSTFAVRMPENAKDLYLATIGQPSAAQYVRDHWEGLPPVLESLVKQAAPRALKVGDRVQGGKGEDFDTGRILSIDGDIAYVGWDSYVQTECPVELLEPERS